MKLFFSSDAIDALYSQIKTNPDMLNDVFPQIDDGEFLPYNSIFTEETQQFYNVCQHIDAKFGHVTYFDMEEAHYLADKLTNEIITRLKDYNHAYIIMTNGESYSKAHIVQPLNTQNYLFVKQGYSMYMFLLMSHLLYEHHIKGYFILANKRIEESYYIIYASSGQSCCIC